jgi:hypothetical protein
MPRVGLQPDVKSFNSTILMHVVKAVSGKKQLSYCEACETTV